MTEEKKTHGKYRSAQRLLKTVPEVDFTYKFTYFSCKNAISDALILFLSLLNGFTATAVLQWHADLSAEIHKYQNQNKLYSQSVLTHTRKFVLVTGA